MAASLLEQALKETNPDKKYALLTEAEKTEGGSLALHKALLLLGDREGYPPGDPRRIRCYALHSLQHPLQHSEQEQQLMAHDLFHHPRLEECLLLSRDSQALLKEYLTALSEQYIQIFLLGDRNMHAFFPLFSRRRIIRRLSLAMGDVIRNIFLSPFLAGEEQSLLAGCFYRACHSQLSGRTDDLDEALGAEICALIR